MPRITSAPLLNVLREAGIATDDTRRVVIDIPAGDLPVVYIEQYGGARTVDIVTAVAGAQIVVKEA